MKPPVSVTAPLSQQAISLQEAEALILGNPLSERLLDNIRESVAAGLVVQTIGDADYALGVLVGNVESLKEAIAQANQMFKDASKESPPNIKLQEYCIECKSRLANSLTIAAKALADASKRAQLKTLGGQCRKQSFTPGEAVQNNVQINFQTHPGTVPTTVTLQESKHEKAIDSRAPVS